MSCSSFVSVCLVPLLVFCTALMAVSALRTDLLTTVTWTFVACSSSSIPMVIFSMDALFRCVLWWTCSKDFSNSWRRIFVLILRRPSWLISCLRTCTSWIRSHSNGHDFDVGFPLPASAYIDPTNTKVHVTKTHISYIAISENLSNGLLVKLKYGNFVYHW